MVTRVGYALGGTSSPAVTFSSRAKPPASTPVDSEWLVSTRFPRVFGSNDGDVYPHPLCATFQAITEGCAAMRPFDWAVASS